jgi:hypothetical protein
MAQATDWRCIIVGDGVDIAPFDDPRITVTRIDRPAYPDDARQRWRILGVRAFAHGLRMVQSDWWSYLADDDAYDPCHHETLLGTADDADCVYGVAHYHATEPGHRQKIPSVPPGNKSVCQGAYIMRTTETVYPTGDVGPGMDGWDADWWDRVVERGLRFRVVPETVFHYYPARNGFGYRWLVDER